jgi:outer membrane protein assembly factor BamB
VVNRGAAIYGDKVFFGTLDAGIVALNKDTGKVVWKKKWGDHKVGYTMTGAPFVSRTRRAARCCWCMVPRVTSSALSAGCLPATQRPARKSGPARWWKATWAA